MGVIKDTLDSIGDLAKAIREFRSGQSVSLPSFLKSTNIMSRTYIEESLFEEDILPHIISMSSQVYAGFIVTALQLNQYVTDSETVRNLLELVASEDYDTSSDIINSKLGNLKVSTEDTKVLSLEQKEAKLFAGKVISLDLNVPGKDDRSCKITVNLFVQLLPFLVPDSVVKQVITLHAGTSLGLRYKKMRAGEISFFWDFLFERDLLGDKQKALKEDQSGLLYTILSQSHNALSKALLRLVNILPKNHNLANTIMIVDNKTFKEACSQSGSDFSNKSFRDKFFKETFLMLFIVVDTSYNKITMYFNGLDTKGEYSFKQLQTNSGSGSGGSDKYDLKDIMNALSHGMSPKF